MTFAIEQEFHDKAPKYNAHVLVPLYMFHEMRYNKGSVHTEFLPL